MAGGIFVLMPFLKKKTTVKEYWVGRGAEDLGEVGVEERL